MAATDVADVAEAAAVAKGTVSLYFESKAELLAELLAGLRARYFERFAARLGDPPTRRERPAPPVRADLHRVRGTESLRPRSLPRREPQH